MNRWASTSLASLNTFGVEAHAGAILELEVSDDVESLEFNPVDDLLLGGGSNVLIVGDIPGTVFLNRLKGFSIVEQENDHVLIQASGGENWHQLVLWTLDQGLSGLENLSLIPGLAGAAPMQNIGAYGVELSTLLHSLTAWDLRKNKWVEFPASECRFGYRDSWFKSGAPERYLITSICLRLNKTFTPYLNYTGVQEELDRMGVISPDAREVSNAIVNIRTRRLPDPDEIGNAGSFFKNPVVPQAQAKNLLEQYPGCPVHPAPGGEIKLSAAWLIDQCGWKGHREGDAGVSPDHALVLVNHGSASGQQLLGLAGRIKDSVVSNFGISLGNEPRIINKEDLS